MRSCTTLICSNKYLQSAYYVLGLSDAEAMVRHGCHPGSSHCQQTQQTCIAFETETCIAFETESSTSMCSGPRTGPPCHQYPQYDMFSQPIKK